MNIAIHIFRRDYRLDDNTTLIETCKTHDIVIPIFIFTPTQINPHKNHYRSDNAVQFLCESLFDLNNQLQDIGKGNQKLFIFYGDEYDILEDLIKQIPELKTISFNKDYTKYAQQRDEHIKKICSQHKINCFSQDDICLHPINTILTGTGNVYMKFTPFWRASTAQSHNIRKPIPNKYKNYVGLTGIGTTTTNKNIYKLLTNHKQAITINDVIKPGGSIMSFPNPNIRVHGGREKGLEILKRLKSWDDYNDAHDNLMWETTHLSAYNKFGCVSIREVYYTMIDKLGKNNGVIRQLFWRDFFYYLSNKFPEIYTHSLNPKYRNIKWVDTSNTNSGFHEWCNGNTGFPVVDACMRELNTTGYMHNRGRLIVSNFLCRMLHINWQDGERYFASKLVDYDPAQNNFGWQVSGGNTSSTTSRPLEQTILNPWLQSTQFDKHGTYIKKWCPELKDVPASDLHKWYDKEICDKWLQKGIKYIKPIVDYKTEKEKNLKLYRKYIIH